MNTTLEVLALILIISTIVNTIFAAEVLFKQKWGKGSKGWGILDDFHHLFDRNTVRNFSGVVTKIKYQSPLKGMSSGILVNVKNDNEELNVWLGPAWYLDHQDEKVTVKEKLEFRGSKIMLNEQPVMLASEVHKGSATLYLHDEHGYPTWCGWKKRSASFKF
ncbi:MAG: hypothetical protein FJ218_04450 [Ignavibacteria bacterium]|nr:hypothetical protein [Ignavibacteria bacterium]